MSSACPNRRGRLGGRSVVAAPPPGRAANGARGRPGRVATAVAIVRCKLRRTPSAAIGAPEVQRFNGTARPDHHATHPIMVTNTRFTAHAKAAGARHGIAWWMAGAARVGDFQEALELAWQCR
ncbi:restriction endonuclease [Streptomyces platensis]